MTLFVLPATTVTMTSCSCGAHKQVEQEQGATLPTSTGESPVDARHKANWARLIQKVYEIDVIDY